jgi:hypothetical protein
MLDTEDIKAAAEAVQGIVKAVPIYQDAVQPVAKEVGKALATVGKAINAALAPLEGLVWGFDQIRDYLSERLAQKLANTRPENITTPPANIAGPAIEALRFAGDDPELREMYASLLATAMDRLTAVSAHPAFVEIVKQLSPDEAKIMKCLADGGNRPVVSVLVVIPGEEGERLITRHQSLLDYEAGVTNPELLPEYLDNLCRLGLTEIPPLLTMVSGVPYEPLENDPDLVSLMEQIRAAGHTPRFERALLRLTDLGRRFVMACIKEHPAAEKIAAVPPNT